jgi:AraC family transcriptional regulator
MKAVSHLLASGPGWRVTDVICAAGPDDRPFEERHEHVCIAGVTSGTFQYRSSQGAAVLGPGALLLGNEGACFECGHAHGVGDRCLAFHLTPDLLDGIVAALPGARRADFALPCLPPSAPRVPLLAAAEAARDEGDGAALEELALRLAAAVAATLAGLPRTGRPPSERDARRITDALRRIEAEADQPLSLADLARAAGMSPYHFLRTFRQVVGVTPHQFILRTRLNRAAVRLRRSSESVSTIAFEAGFNDLSTFNRRFRRIMGASPSAYRARGACEIPGSGRASDVA